MINYFKNRQILKARAKELYDRAEAQARLPLFYKDLGVPDTVDGRFELISLHAYIMMRRLAKMGDKKLAQKLFDAFFVQMDLSLREMGVGDLGVPKHMKRMMQGFNGRANHYEAAVLTEDREELKHALIQNVYGTMDRVDNNHVEIMSDYILDNIKVQSAEEGYIAPNLEGDKVHA